MKTLQQVTDKLYSLFDEFSKSKIDPDSFVNELRKVTKGKGDKGYWWRFFSGDTLANNWRSVSSSFDSFKNTKYLLEYIEIALRDKSIIVLYS